MTVLCLGVALLAVGCGRGADSKGITEKPSLEFVQSDGFTFSFHRLSAGSYVAYGTSTAAVHDPVRVVDVKPLSHHGAAEFVGARLAFFACQPNCRARPGYWGVRSLFGALCGPGIPKSRAIYEAKDALLFPGDAPNFILVAKVLDVGDAAFDGIIVTYEKGGRRHEVASHVNGLSLDTEPPSAKAQCVNPRTDPWFGGSREATLVKQL